MRILHIEGDARVAEAVATILRAADMIVDRTDAADEGLCLAKYYDYDAILLEPAGLDAGGTAILRRLRDAKVATPVLILTNEQRLEARLALLDSGADDALTKPFHPAELRARVGAIVRRARRHADSKITIGDLEVALDSRSVRVCGQPLHATAKEFALLELLALRRNAVMTKDMIMSRLYGGRDEPELKIIDVFVCKLRKKIAAIAGHGAIETVWGRGYMLRDPEAAT